MATILNDAEIEKLLGKVIKNGVKDSIRPNSYIIRLGSEGEYLGTGRTFILGEDKERKGIKLPPNHSVGVSSIEEIDFSQETVNMVFPGQALHGFLAPTTDFSREGVGTSSTQIDAGFRGSLNWTLTNTSNQERRYVFGEPLFRLTIFKLDQDETPKEYYTGFYQEKRGYVRSQRKGPPVGMRETEWEDPYVDDSPEESLDRLMKAGYPWQAVALHLKEIDEKGQVISREYQTIKESMDIVEKKMTDFEPRMNSLIRNAVKEEIPLLYNWAIVRVIGALGIVIGLIIATTTNQQAMGFILNYGILLGLVIVTLGTGFLIWSRPGKSKNGK